MTRSPEEVERELQVIDAAHAQNEAGRDAFVALAHTALFAASVSFVGDVAPVTHAKLLPVLLFGWTADVVGLLALTVSFSAARRFTDARRRALYEPEAPAGRLPKWLNAISLWSFPVALVCVFLFVLTNVVAAHEQQGQRTSPTRTRAEGIDPAPTRSLPANAMDGSNSPASGAITAPAASFTVEEVGSQSNMSGDRRR